MQRWAKIIKFPPFQLPDIQSNINWSFTIAGTWQRARAASGTRPSRSDSSYAPDSVHCVNGSLPKPFHGGLWSVIETTNPDARKFRQSSSIVVRARENCFDFRFRWFSVVGEREGTGGTALKERETRPRFKPPRFCARATGTLSGGERWTGGRGRREW